MASVSEALLVKALRKKLTTLQQKWLPKSLQPSKLLDNLFKWR
jgi:hypothetical protein